MIENNLIKIDSVQQAGIIEAEKLSIENQRLKEKNAELCDLYILNYNLNNKGENPKDIRFCDKVPPLSTVSQECFGNARCFSGIITKVIDGDTIEVDGKPIRFALVNTPEYGEYGFEQATNYIS